MFQLLHMDMNKACYIYNWIKICLIIFIALGVFYSCTSTPKNEYTISGKIDNLTDSSFFLIQEFGDSLKIDTVRVNSKGEFTYKSVADTLSIVTLYFHQASVTPYVLVDKDYHIDIKGSINQPDLLQVRGGKINDELTKFKVDHASLLQKRNNLLAKSSSKDLIDLDSLVIKDYSGDLQNVNFELLNQASDYVKANPDKISSVFIIDNFFRNEASIQRLTEALNSLKGQAYDFPLTEKLRAYLAYIRPSAVGSTMPAFKLKDINGKEVDSNSLRGKYSVFIFGSSTYNVSNDIIAIIKDEYKSLQKDNIEINFVIFAVDPEGTPLPSELLSLKKSYIIPLYGGYSSEILQKYNITALPYTIWIDPLGKIIERNIPLFNLKSRIELIKK